MNVASLELCQELYKLSGWEDSFFFWNKDEQYVEGKQWRVQSGRIFPSDIPAYDLGYLLRKLPEELDKRILVITPGEHTYAGYTERDNYGNYSLDSYFYKYAQYSDMSEDAVCKLTIELFKSGVLKKEGTI